MSDWLGRVFEDVPEMADKNGGRVMDQLDGAAQQDVTVDVEVELELEATLGLEGSWTDSEGETRDWGNSTTLDTGRTELDLTLSTDMSQTDVDF